MGLFKRKKNGKFTNVWWMCFTADGVQHRKSTGTSNRKSAQKILNKIETQIAEGKWLDIDTAKFHDFDELMQRYLNEHSKINKAASTYEKDLSMKANLEETFKGMPLDKITSNAIVFYKNKRLTEGVAQNTVKNELGMLRNALNIAQHIWKWIRENPFSGLKLGLKANEIDRWLNPEEEKLLLTAAEGKLFGTLPDIIFLDLHTGLSQEEILNLKWSQIDFTSKTLRTIRKKTKKKDRPARIIPLNAAAVEILTRRAKVQSLSGYVFFNTVGNKIDAGKLKKTFKKAWEDSGIASFRFHDLRHTFATRLAQRGVDLYKIAKLLGHEDISTTQRYAHHCSESLRDGVEILDNQATSVLEEKPATLREKRKRKKG